MHYSNSAEPATTRPNIRPDRMGDRTWMGKSGRLGVALQCCSAVRCDGRRRASKQSSDKAEQREHQTTVEQTTVTAWRLHGLGLVCHWTVDDWHIKLELLRRTVTCRCARRSGALPVAKQ